MAPVWRGGGLRRARLLAPVYVVRGASWWTALQSPRYQWRADSWTLLNRSAANPVPLAFSQITSWESFHPADSNSRACCRNMRMLPKHHRLLETAAAVVSHPSGHRSHASEVSPYGGSAHT